MKHFLLLGALALLFVSCKKDQDEPNPPSAAAYTMPTTEGSYWVYHWSKVDTAGNVTPAPYIDTVRITGQVTQNGHTWTEYTGTSMGTGQHTWLQRDSSGYIINANGRILYSYVGTSPFHTTSDAFYSEVHQMGSDVVLSGIFGIAGALDRQQVITRSPLSTLPVSEGVNACGDESYTFHTYYVSGIGEVEQTCALYAQFISQCVILRKQLVAYHIE